VTALGAAAPAPCSPDLILPPGFDRLGEVVRIDLVHPHPPMYQPPDLEGIPIKRARAGSLDGEVPQPGDDPCEGVRATLSRGFSASPAQSHPEPEEEPVDTGPLPTLLLMLRQRATPDRGATLPNRSLSRDERRAGKLLVYPDVDRPRSRGECQEAARPCPFVSCRHHLYLDVDVDSGSLKVNFPDLEPWELEETCALDVADRGGVTLEEAGALIHVTRERTRQIETQALRRARLRNFDLAEEL
jgi:hypothetical protein